MMLVGADYAEAFRAGRIAELKMVFNEAGAILFPVAQQHRDQKAPGVSYEDDHRGNALAAIVIADRVEVRLHSAFSNERVIAIIEAMIALPELAFLQQLRATYGGRPCTLSGRSR